MISSTTCGLVAGDPTISCRKIDLVKDEGGEDPFLEMHKSDLKDLITKSLTKKEKLIIVLYYYEGLSMGEVVFPVRCLKMLGVDKLIVTNAAGSLNPDYQPGDLMLIRDHIKLVTDSPLRGRNIDEFGPRFNDMSDPYSKEIRDLVKACGKKLNIELKEGVYCYMPGPSYETASEVRMLGLLGGHAVGMSTVPEVITAVHSGMKVLGLSCITNMGTGIVDQPLHHEEIIRVGEQVRKTFITLLEAIVGAWPPN